MRKELSIEIIEKWMKDPDYDVRTAAMNSCAGRDVPLFCKKEEAENYQ